MSMMLDRLRRFRPVGTPGGAGAVGVPEDSRGGVPAELVPVFAALDAVIAECADLRAQASRQAADVLATARAEADRIVSAARDQAAGERAGITAAIRARGDDEVDRTLATATTDAGALREAGLRQMDRLVAVVIDRLRTDVQEPVR